MKEKNLIEEIKNHTLGNKKEAFDLYNKFCDYLKKKYGSVDKDYDENPTKKGKEWIDIHHILEYELDDIARRTDNAKWAKREVEKNNNERMTIVLKNEDWNNEELKKSLKEKHKDKAFLRFIGQDMSLDELKPYNKKDKLVYANKIEHFLLHYLISSIHGRDVFEGGINYLWDNCVALELYGFNRGHLIDIQNEKEKYYSILTPEEITILYKKIINWKNWNLEKYINYWKTYRQVILHFESSGISYFKNIDKMIELFNILEISLDGNMIQNIKPLPFKAKIIKDKNGERKAFNDMVTSMDEKKVYWFRNCINKTYTVPKSVDHIMNNAFYFASYLLEQITIPETLKSMDDNVFINSKKTGKCVNLKKIIYQGTHEDWNKKFSNVNLLDIKLVCKKK